MACPQAMVTASAAVSKAAVTAAMSKSKRRVITLTNTDLWNDVLATNFARASVPAADFMLR